MTLLQTNPLEGKRYSSLSRVKPLKRRIVSRRVFILSARTDCHLETIDELLKGNKTLKSEPHERWRLEHTSKVLGCESRREGSQTLRVKLL